MVHVALNIVKTTGKTRDNLGCYQIRKS